MKVTIRPDQEGDRLDRVLSIALAPLSRNRCQELIRTGAVRCGSEIVTLPRHAVVAGEAYTVTVPEPEAAAPEAQPIALDILFEDDQLIVVNKPAGLVVHPAPGNPDNTLVNALLHHCGDSLAGIGGVKRPGIVHRLDKDTSGVMVVAKTERAHNDLAAQFADHGRTGPLERTYFALVWGIPRPRSGRIETLIGRAPHNRLKQAVLKHGGRTAITHYAVARDYGSGPAAVAAVTCNLETGRTHQIRVHLAHIGHPLLGDLAYGKGFSTKATLLEPVAQDALTALGRQALHAATLSFAHPVSTATMRFSAPPPADMQALTATLTT